MKEKVNFIVATDNRK